MLLEDNVCSGPTFPTLLLLASHRSFALFRRWGMPPQLPSSSITGMWCRIYPHSDGFKEVKSFIWESTRVRIPLREIVMFCEKASTLVPIRTSRRLLTGPRWTAEVGTAAGGWLLLRFAGFDFGVLSFGLLCGRHLPLSKRTILSYRLSSPWWCASSSNPRTMEEQEGVASEWLAWRRQENHFWNYGRVCNCCRLNTGTVRYGTNAGRMCFDKGVICTDRILILLKASVVSVRLASHGMSACR